MTVQAKRMYRENRKSLNAFVGCLHDCVYCRPSFQRQAKRRRKYCEDCYRYYPHFHPERLEKPPPKTVGDDFIFFPSMGDPCFASLVDMMTMIGYARKFSDRRFLTQTKNPRFFQNYEFPNNMILGITLETDHKWFDTPSKYKTYDEISKAPSPLNRVINFIDIKHQHKYVTIEPILQMNPIILSGWIRAINPEVVYVGYDNWNCRLPEPPLDKTMTLISELEKFTTVRHKTLRHAWWEKN